MCAVGGARETRTAGFVLSVCDYYQHGRHVCTPTRLCRRLRLATVPLIDGDMMVSILFQEAAHAAHEKIRISRCPCAACLNTLI